MISVIDYGMGNLRSVVKAVELYTDEVKISSTPEDISKADAIILPGDGAFAHAMENLKEMGLVDPIRRFILDGRKFLGICLGYQLLFSESEEFGTHKGLDIIKGRVIKFDNSNMKVPHMGWNNVSIKKESKYLNGIDDNTHFYFIHTYYPVVLDDTYITGVCNYGGDFTCIVSKDNMIATQFHPEKSHKAGLKIIENFVRN